MNTCIFSGKISTEINLKFITSGPSSGKAVANFNLAVPRTQKNPDTGNYEADFLRICIFGKPAENLANICQKGDTIEIVSRCVTRNYVREDKRVYITEFIANQFTLLFKSRKNQENNSIKQTSTSPQTRKEEATMTHNKTNLTADAPKNTVDNDIFSNDAPVEDYYAF